MNYKLIELLKNSTDYLSGEEISNKFGISRTAIWKQINTLKEKGYNIDAIPNRGYKLIASPDLIDLPKLTSLLSSSFLGKTIKYSFSTTSTNEDAKKFASKNLNSNGTVFISEEQTKGKGRLGRCFHSPKGGVYLSIILTPNLEPQHASKITQILAAALCKSLKDLNISSKIKWPNDIYVNNKKLSGILTEMKCDMDRIKYIIAGIGININTSKEELPEELKSIATSLNIEYGHNFDKTTIISNFLKTFEELYLDFIENNNLSKTISICKENSLILDKKATHITSRGEEKVTCIGINDEGELIVKDSLGNIKTIISGEISFKKS